MTKEERIAALLESYAYASETLQAGGDAGGWSDNDDGSRSRMLLMPSAWHHGGYRELERCLATLKVDRPDLYWHVVHRFFRVERRPRELEIRKGAWVGVERHWRVEPSRPNTRESYSRIVAGRSRTVARAMVEFWDERVLPVKVDEGVAWLAREFRGSPQVPRVVYEELAA